MQILKIVKVYLNFVFRTITPIIGQSLLLIPLPYLKTNPYFTPSYSSLHQSLRPPHQNPYGNLWNIRFIPRPNTRPTFIVQHRSLYTCKNSFSPPHTKHARRRRTGWWGGFLRPLTALPGRRYRLDGEVPRPKQLHPRAAILLKMRGRGLPEGWPRPAKVAPFFDWCMPGPFVQPRATICPLPAPRDRCPPTSPPFFRAILKERLVPLAGGPGRRRRAV